MINVNVNRFLKYIVEKWSKYPRVDLDVSRRMMLCHMQVHHLNLDMTSYTLYSSTMMYDDIMHFNVYDNHISFICHIDKYSKRFMCGIYETSL